MNQRSRITGHTAPTTTHADEALRRTVTTPTITPRRLIATGIKRGTGPLLIQKAAA